MIDPFDSLLIAAYVHYSSYVDVQNLSRSLLVLTFNNLSPTESSTSCKIVVACSISCHGVSSGEEGC